MRKGNRTAKVPVSVLPTPEEAVDAYQQTGGQLTLFPKFGSDSLDGHSDLQDARHQVSSQSILTLNHCFLQ